MSRCMLRYQVVVNDRSQKIEMRGDWLAPARVEASTLGSGANAQHVVEFWSEGDLDGPTAAVWLQVFGTGHPLPEGARWWGTSARTREGLVWHLYEVAGVCSNCGKSYTEPACGPGHAMAARERRWR